MVIDHTEPVCSVGSMVIDRTEQAVDRQVYSSVEPPRCYRCLVPLCFISNHSFLEYCSLPPVY